MAIASKTLTAANSVLQVRCKGVYDQYVRLQGFQVDNVFGFGERAIGETRAGVDGILSGGYVFNESQFTVSLEANSPSVTVLDNCSANIQNNMETLPFDFVVELPSVKKRYSFSGFLVTIPSGVSANKLLAGVQYVFNVDKFNVEEIN